MVGNIIRVRSWSSEIDGMEISAAGIRWGFPLELRAELNGLDVGASLWSFHYIVNLE